MGSQTDVEWLQGLLKLARARDIQNELPSFSRLKVGCIGAGYVGGPTMSTIAAKCPHISVFVADKCQEKIRKWNEGGADVLPFPNNYCPDSKSVGLSHSEDYVTLPIYEPGLEAVVRACRGRNLFFTTDCDAVIRECDVIFVCVNTPTKRTGVGAGAAADLRSWELAARQIARISNSQKIIVEKSTVPVKTAESLAGVLQANELPGVRFFILSNPEFLAEGTAMSDLEKPDRVLIGGKSQCEAGRLSIEVLAEIYGCWVKQERIIRSNIWSAELSKLVANAFLAQRVSSVNAVAALCERTGADIKEVTRVVGSDSRIGSRFLNASVGFGGSCFQKDILSLVYLCEVVGLPEVAAFWHQTVFMNDYQQRRFSRMIVESMFSCVNGKKIAIFGFAFKKDTCDSRESPAIEVCKRLMLDGANLYVFDPKVTASEALKEFEAHSVLLSEVAVWKHLNRPSNTLNDGQLGSPMGNKPSNNSDCYTISSSLLTEPLSSPQSCLNFPTVQKYALGDHNETGTKERPIVLDGKLLSFVQNPYDAVRDAHAIVVITEWDEFISYDYEAFFNLMKKPAFIFDGRCILDHAQLKKIGFRVRRVGAPPCDS